MSHIATLSEFPAAPKVLDTNILAQKTKELLTSTVPLRVESNIVLKAILVLNLVLSYFVSQHHPLTVFDLTPLRTIVANARE